MIVRRHFLFFLVALQCIIAASAAACDSTTCKCAKLECVRRGAWSVARSQNFEVYSLLGDRAAKSVAEQCESLKAALVSSLKLDDRQWNPPCQVILHSTKAHYLRAVGKGADTTLGSALVRSARGTISSRRIDLRIDVVDYLSNSLPHELCHVVLADEFPDGRPPLWYDEGIALLADTPSKQLLHHRDLVQGIHRGEQFPLTNVLTARRYPSNRLGVFYGQCTSLTHLLLTLGPPEQIHQFAKRSEEIGVNLAMKECYGVSSVSELEHIWRENLVPPSKPALASVLLVLSKEIADDRDGATD